LDRSRIPSDAARTLAAVQGDHLRRGIAEFIGAFTLVFIATGAIMHGTGGLIGLAFAYGIALAVMIAVFAHISGGHFNPAVTLAFLVTRRITAALAGVYMLLQFAGGCAASLLLWWIFPASAIATARLGAPVKHELIGSGAGFALEAIMTFFLVLAYFATTVDERNAFKGLAAFAVGLVLTMDTLCGGPLTGAAMNPARAFGPEVVYKVWESYTWIYYAGPAVGAILAAVLYELMYLQAGVRISLPRRRSGGEPASGDVAGS
jgi:MIP family channel proteins